MPIFGFNDRRKAERLRQIADTPSPPARPGQGLAYTDLFLFKATSGIPGRSGTTLGAEECDMYHLSDNGTNVTYTQTLDSSGAAIKANVVNFSEGAVDTGAFVWCGRGYNQYVAIYQDCG